MIGLQQSDDTSRVQTLNNMNTNVLRRIPPLLYVP